MEFVILKLYEHYICLVNFYYVYRKKQWDYCNRMRCECSDQAMYCIQVYPKHVLFNLVMNVMFVSEDRYQINPSVYLQFRPIHKVMVQ